MNKTAKIIVTISILLSAFFMTFAWIKKTEADQLAEHAIKLYSENKISQAEAERQAELAVRRTAEALEAQYIARNALEQLEECEKSK